MNIEQSIKAPEGTVYLAVMSAGLAGCFFRSRSVVGALEGLRAQTAADFNVRKGKTFNVTLYHVDDVEWEVGASGIHSTEGKVHSHCYVQLTSRVPGLTKLVDQHGNEI